MSWSVAIVTPVFRHNSSVDNPSFYHPVSVMPAMVLLLEHVIITQIYNFIAPFIPQNQYGVVKGTGAQCKYCCNCNSSSELLARMSYCVCAAVDKFDWVDCLI